MPEPLTLDEAEAAKMLDEYPLPWTLEKLGEEKYKKLAVEGRYFNSPPVVKHYAPDLAPPEAVLAAHRKREEKKKAEKKQ